MCFYVSACRMLSFYVCSVVMVYVLFERMSVKYLALFVCNILKWSSFAMKIILYTLLNQRKCIYKCKSNSIYYNFSIKKVNLSLLIFYSFPTKYLDTRKLYAKPRYVRFVVQLSKSSSTGILAIIDRVDRMMFTGNLVKIKLPLLSHSLPGYISQMLVGPAFSTYFHFKNQVTYT